MRVYLCRSLPLPVTSFPFMGSELEPAAGASLEPLLHASMYGGSSSGGADTAHFVSSVAWSRRGSMLLAANSVGAIKLLSWV